MLRLIRIRNYAIVDEIDVEFESGFNVLTGETGAGKSILIDALGLALGDRADSNAVRSGADKAEISVLFECPTPHPALDWLAQHDLDDGDNCSLRRIVTAEGRSRAFINNHPVKLQDLRDLGAMLIDIHGQHAHQSLLRQTEQRQMLDAIAGALALVKSVSNCFSALQRAIERRDALASNSQARLEQIELLRFQHRELDELALQEGEVEDLISEHYRLANVDQVAEGVQTALNAIYEIDEGSAHALVTRSIQSLVNIGDVDTSIEGVVEQLRSAEIELRDIASSLAHYRDSLEPNPQRLADVEARLASIRSLAKRHKLDDTELWQQAADLQVQLTGLEDSDESVEALQERVDQAAADYQTAAEQLSRLRRKLAKQLSANVSRQLKKLGLPNGEFRVQIEPRTQPHSAGLDVVEFQVQLNPGQAFGPLARVASGGELSRISLALQVVGEGRSNIPTFVFDEVDAGIGGGVAEIVGLQLRNLAGEHQVICVTHQAQVASQGQTHFRIAKLTDGKTSRTLITQLDAAQRLEELSRMLGGVEITETTRAHAAEMLSRAASN